MNIQDIDPIYVLCFVLLIIIIVLEFRDRQFKNKEEFERLGIKRHNQI